MPPAERDRLLRPAVLLAVAAVLVASSPAWERLAAYSAISGFFGYLIGRVLYTCPALTSDLPSMEERPVADRDHTDHPSHVQLQFDFGNESEPLGFSRDCPVCGKEIWCKLKTNRDRLDRKKAPCRVCYHAKRSVDWIGENNPFYGKKHTEETLTRMRMRTHPHTQTEEFRSGAARRMSIRNPMKGSSVYQRWVEKFGKEKADELMEIRRQKTSAASSGANNPMFGKPAPQGSGNGWSGWYKGWFFRSFRELAYMLHVIEAEGHSWRSAETADLKIPYLDYKGAARTYTADFLINERLLVEVKPIRLHDSPTVKAKRAAAVAFCQKIGLEYQIADVTPLSDGEIADLHASGQIRFTERYEAKFTARTHKHD